MGKLGLLLHVGAVVLYCRYLAPLADSDVPIYVWSLLLSLPALRTHALLSTKFALNFVFMVGITTWICHFLLAPELQDVTARLRYVRGILLTLFLVIEVVAAVHLARRYLSARRAGAFAGNAFVHALAPYPLLPGMTRLFLVEFIIWRALLVRLGMLSDRDGNGLRRLAWIDTGYSCALAGAAIALAAGANLLCSGLSRHGCCRRSGCWLPG